MLIDKPAGMTSHDVISRLRRIFGQKRIGHAGTLDPEATGLLVVAVGNVTKLLSYFQEKSKTYFGEVVFGVETDSYDSSGNVLWERDVNELDLEKLSRAVASLTGDVRQLPPIVSAIKVRGRKLYEYHRESKQVDIEPRDVHIQSIRFSKTPEPNVIRIEVECGPGTYIRSIAHDLGESMGTGAHLRNLRRIRSGGFDVGAALSIDQVASDSCLGPSEALKEFVAVGVSGSQAERARNGSRIAIGGESSDMILVYDSGRGPFVEWDQLIGLFSRVSGDLYKANVVLPAIN